MNIKCIGCGAEIQTTDNTKKGYIKQEVFEKNPENFYCKRCFDLRHYNRENKIDVDLKEYTNNLSEIRKDKGLIVLIVDSFNFESTMIYNINKLFLSENILLVLNKVDLYLNTFNLNILYMYVRNFLKTNKIKVKDMMMLSSFNDFDIQNLIAKIDEYNNNQNVYFVGMTNVGKSTIVNKIIASLTEEEDLITVSNTINTTLDNIYIPYKENLYFVDTPGIINEKNIIYYLDKETLKFITPKSFIKPKTFQLNPNQTLFVAGFARIDFSEGERASFVTNFSNTILIHRTKLENADDFYLKHADDILVYPTPLERNRLGKFVNKEIETTLSDKKDIVLSGIGYITVVGNCKIRITHFENINIIIRKAII